MNKTDEPTLVIQGRVAPTRIALATEFLIAQGYRPTSRSDLVAMVFEVCCGLAQMRHIQAPGDNHTALGVLQKRGIEWPVGPYRKDLVKAMAYDSMKDMSMEEFLEVQSRVIQVGRTQTEHLTQEEESPTEFDIFADMSQEEREKMERLEPLDTPNTE